MVGLLSKKKKTPRLHRNHNPGVVMRALPQLGYSRRTVHFKFGQKSLWLGCGKGHHTMERPWLKLQALKALIGETTTCHGPRSIPQTIDSSSEERFEGLKQEVRRMLIEIGTDQPDQKLSLIDGVQRLGVGYHFKSEIEDALKKLYHDSNYNQNDLYTVALRFRLLRQNGFKASSDKFEKFKDSEGKFKESLIEDVDDEESNAKLLGRSKWRDEGYIPTMEEYMKVSLVTSCYPMLATTSFFGMGAIATKDAFEWVSSDPKILRASSIVCRLMDDIVSHEFEQKREHVASGVECYMKEHGVSEEEVMKLFRKQIANAWKDINEECLKPTQLQCLC
ncbi:hypothetical protein GH714_008471 [Hevea brasiliensis]|uniref:Terpene synthase N-terminal domain-containing protein n=1 Tax=Hevea brasiliensis TaxID=3981 RepID=A0A6A6KAK5_HEVBR|nr:hypothetical protein GH714_008471 [Hevea brasiliensis]